jgi:glycosyltransferase involved in cell wall biosynthesis
MNPKLSVITSIFDSEGHLEESVRSILDQGFRDFELIVVNDGSTDGSAEIVRELAARDERIVFIENKTNLGLTRSLNKAIELAKGEYIARQDTDDVSLPGRLQAQVDFLDAHNDIFLVGTNAYLEHPRIDTFVRGIVTDPDRIARLLPYSNQLVHTSIMFRNSGEMYREKFRYAQDYDFYLYLLRRGKRLGNLPDPLVIYRVRANTITSSRSKQQALFAQAAQQFYREYGRTGEDGYGEFDGATILDVETSGSADCSNDLKTMIDYMCFNNKGQALKTLLQFGNELDTGYLAKKILSIMIPSGMEKLRYKLRGGSR